MDLMKNALGTIRDTIEEHIQDHEATFDADAEPRDFMDMFLKKTKEEKGKLLQLSFSLGEIF